MDFRGILVVCVFVLERFLWYFGVISIQDPVHHYLPFYFCFVILLAFVDKSFYFIELGSLSFRVIFAGLKYQRDHRCHGDVTRIIIS